jgi:hypothetical protein
MFNFTQLNSLENNFRKWGTLQGTNPKTYDGACGLPETAHADRVHALEYSSSTSRVYITGTTCESGWNNNITTLAYNANNGAFVWGTSYDYASDIYVGPDFLFWKYALQVRQGCTGRDYIYLTGNSVCCSQAYNILTLKYKLEPACGDGNEGRMVTGEIASDSFYPNPFSTEAVLELNSLIEILHGTLSVYDVNGRLAATIDGINSNTVTIQRGDMPAGIYFFQLTNGENIISNGKFIIAD